MALTTLLPTGIISGGPTWCIQDLYAWNHGRDAPPYELNTCGNTTQSDFLSICCDGNIIDTTTDMYQYVLKHKTLLTYPLDLTNLVCCREANVRQMGGIGPFPNPTRCDAVLKPTPLASLAATNTANAAPYLATFESGRWDDKISQNVDWVRTETPECLWVQTKGEGVTVSLGEVTVPKAEITTPPVAGTDATTATTTKSRTSTSAVVKSTSKSEGVKAGRMGGVVLGLASLGLVVALLMER
jgi:hypothetical protein